LPVSACVVDGCTSGYVSLIYRLLTRYLSPKPTFIIRGTNHVVPLSELCVHGPLGIISLSLSSPARPGSLLYTALISTLIVSLLHTSYPKCLLPPLAAHSVLSSHQRSLLQEQSYVAYSSICPTQSHTPLILWPCWRDAIGNTILTIQSSGTTSARTASVIEFYSKLPKGPLPASERAGGLRGRYFEGKNASGYVTACKVATPDVRQSGIGILNALCQNGPMPKRPHIQN
jgi:hypothetical protein